MTMLHISKVTTLKTLQISKAFNFQKPPNLITPHNRSNLITVQISKSKSQILNLTPLQISHPLKSHNTHSVRYSEGHIELSESRERLSTLTKQAVASLERVREDRKNSLPPPHDSLIDFATFEDRQSKQCLEEKFPGYCYYVLLCAILPFRAKITK